MSKEQFSVPFGSGRAFIDKFSSLDDLKGKDRRDRKKVLAALAAAGKFSCFEIDNAMAATMTWLCNKSGWIRTIHSVIEMDEDGRGTHTRDLYPWTYVELTEAGRAALAAND